MQPCHEFGDEFHRALETSRERLERLLKTSARDSRSARPGARRPRTCPPSGRREGERGGGKDRANWRPGNTHGRGRPCLPCPPAGRLAVPPFLRVPLVPPPASFWVGGFFVSLPRPPALCPGFWGLSARVGLAGLCLWPWVGGWVRSRCRGSLARFAGLPPLSRHHKEWA
jgi:hypothetical protein